MSKKEIWERGCVLGGSMVVAGLCAGVYCFGSKDLPIVNQLYSVAAIMSGPLLAMFVGSPGDSSLVSLALCTSPLMLAHPVYRSWQSAGVTVFGVFLWVLSGFMTLAALRSV